MTRIARVAARAGRAIAVSAAAVALTLGGAQPASASSDERGTVESFRVQVAEEPGASRTIGLDVDLYLPTGGRAAPAVLLAHGFGASKDSLARDARRLQGDGYVVMAYSARGFGDSDGRISLDSVDHEVADASALVDVLEDRDEVRKDDGDPMVGVAGASYGGALALMLGATDDRIDTVVASITWNDLAEALVPESTVGGDQPGVFKEAWAAQLFGAASSPRSGACGRFTPRLCDLYTDLVAGDGLDAGDRALLADSSPASVLDGMTAPTLLLQGTEDTLFGLDQADANARQIAAAGAPVQVSWFTGGHDAGGAETAGITAQVDAWLADRLPTDGSAPARVDGPLPFEFRVPTAARTFGDTRVASAYPGIGEGTDAVGAATPSVSGDSMRLPMFGRDQRVVNPPGGLPATVTSLPGVGSVDELLAAAGQDTDPTQAERAQGAGFVSAPVEEDFVLTGAPSVNVDVAAARSRADDADVPLPTETVLFAQLLVISGDVVSPVGGGGVAPVRVALPADGSRTTVEVRLPATVWRFEEGDRALLILRTTDSLYQGSPIAAAFEVESDGLLALPTVAAGDPRDTGGQADPAALIGIVVVLLLAAALAVVAWIRGRRRDRAPSSSASPAFPAGLPRSVDAPPLVIRGLTKDYRSGFRAVDDLSFRVEHGQVLGLLGPNGAGKTTALRMVTGLLRPDAGEIEIFGERVTPGARVLDRVGCFIEGPGFLPHLSGRRNLELYWAASGRPIEEARLDDALTIADLGIAIRRRVGGYSQGMRQRLAIAQAMLGMPELLILDEPTNGLDPPQIHALRGVLRRYAESGRTVIVSSHLLGEVEQTCTDVVVMAHGRLLAAGTVADLAGESTELTVEVTDADAATRALARLGGAEVVLVAADTLRVRPGAHSPEAVVGALTAAGVGVRSVVRGRHLEETFLAMVGAEEIT